MTNTAASPKKALEELEYSFVAIEFTEKKEGGRTFQTPAIGSTLEVEFWLVNAYYFNYRPTRYIVIALENGEEQEFESCTEFLSKSVEFGWLVDDGTSDPSPFLKFLSSRS